MNALAAMAAAAHVGVSPVVAAQALGSFENVRRRMELRGSDDPIAELEQHLNEALARRIEIESELSAARRELESADADLRLLDERRLLAGILETSDRRPCAHRIAELDGHGRDLSRALREDRCLVKR